MLLYEIRVLCHPLSQIIQERGLKTRERVVVVRYLRACKLVGLWVALAGKTVNDWTAWITHTHHLGALVYGLACSIVYGLAYDFHVVVGTHQNNLTVSATDKQTQERERWRGMLFAILVNEVGKYMPLEMINLYHGDTQTCSQTFGETYTYKQRTHESRTSGKGNGRKFLTLYPSLFQCLVHNGDNVLLMGTTGQFGHNTAVGFMHCLRCCHVGQKHAIPDDSSTGIVARRFYSKNYHCFYCEIIFLYFVY